MNPATRSRASQRWQCWSQAFPGRADLADALDLIGQRNRWHAWSVAPQRTLDALLSLGPPLVAMALTSQLDAAGRRALLKTIVVMGLLSVLVGTLQLAAGAASPFLFYGDEAGALYGFQANRNSEADVLLIALLALVAAWAGQRGGGGRDTWPGVAALALLLVLGTALTTSRTGVLLIPVAVLFAAAMLRGRLPSLRLPRWTWGAGLAGLLGLAWWVWRSPVLQRVLARFDFTGEYRIDIWRDTLFAIRRSWPLGTGMGTFTHAIFPAERLEAIGATLPNRAHNELLELALEGGLPVLLCWGAIAVIVLAALRRALRTASGSARLPVLFAAGTLTVTALHSLVDYPFRSMALAGLVGVAAGIVLRAGAAPTPEHSSHGDGQV
jgi:O-antigen ligase